jgi:hypothetical protein
MTGGLSASPDLQMPEGNVRADGFRRLPHHQNKHDKTDRGRHCEAALPERVQQPHSVRAVVKLIGSICPTRTPTLVTVKDAVLGGMESDADCITASMLRHLWSGRKIKDMEPAQ